MDEEKLKEEVMDLVTDAGKVLSLDNIKPNTLANVYINLVSNFILTVATGGKGSSKEKAQLIITGYEQFCKALLESMSYKIKELNHEKDE